MNPETLNRDTFSYLSSDEVFNFPLAWLKLGFIYEVNESTLPIVSTELCCVSKTSAVNLFISTSAPVSTR